MTFDTDDKNYENQLPSVQRLQTTVESRYGKSFSSPLGGIDIEDFPDGIGHGAFDYSTRRLKINKSKLVDVNYSPEETLEHEATHILERDHLGGDPIHPHIVHATFINSERDRLVGMSGIDGDQLSFKKLFGDEFQIDNSNNMGITKENIVLIEEKLNQILKEEHLSERTQTVASIVAMDLSLIKTAYLSESLSKINSQLVFEYEKAMQNIKPQRILLGNIALYSFDEEISTLVNIVQESKRAPKDG